MVLNIFLAKLAIVTQFSNSQVSVSNELPQQNIGQLKNGPNIYNADLYIIKIKSFLNKPKQKHPKSTKIEDSR